MNKNPKLLAFYLPQYHEIPENNKWWGKGFTDWVNVKKAKPLFPGHYQPRVPLNKNYYNPLNPETLKWQANLAKKYGIYGFCFYHYWFNGKLLLEKPTELLLKHKEIDLPFCFSWANEPWTRTWDGENNNVLMPQEYGNKEDWVKHFNYLLKFFKDKRYIKINKKPLFLVYRTNSMLYIDEMMRLWNELAVKNGFGGIYFLETLTAFQIKSCSKLSEGVVEFEPPYTNQLIFEATKNRNKTKSIFVALRDALFRLTKAIKIPITNLIGPHRANKFVNIIYTSKRRLDNIINSILFKEKPLIKGLSKGSELHIMDYNATWEQIIKRKSNYDNKKAYLGAFTDWDNTPRKSDGYVWKSASPEKFRHYLKKQLEKAKKYGSEFIFINAWNEWAEGAYLEPDEKFDYRYLEAIRNVLAYYKK